MPRFEAFAGLRYDPQVVALGDVVAPPYDVIDPAQRQRLAFRSPYNAVRVELPEGDLTAGLDRYAVAATSLERWIERGALVQDPAPSLYPYRMTTPDGWSSTGVIGALGLGGDDILPHEQTLPKPRSDRLDLLRATRTNLSPIWGLSMTAGLSEVIVTAGPPAVDVHDDDGVRHQLWVMARPGAIDQVTSAVASSPVVLADGHHRYQVALTYREQQAGPGPHDLVMAYVVELSEDQVRVGAIHRTMEELPAGTNLLAAFGRWFDLVRAGGANRRTVGALAGADSLALVTPSDAWLLIPRPAVYQAATGDLDANLFDVVDATLPPHATAHSHSWGEALAAVESGEAQCAVLLRPVSVPQLVEWAKARRRMPPKTTYFNPKLRTGLVFRRLDP